MDTNNETRIRNFVQNQLNDAPDLSVLTLGILKRQYMSHVGCESLSPEAKTCIKRIVEEELLNMQTSGTDISESENASVVPSSNKRKREDDEAGSGGSVDDDESSAKKICHRSTSSGRAGNGSQVNALSFETGCDGSEKEAQVDKHRDKVQESEEDQEQQMNISDRPQYLKGTAGNALECQQKLGKRERKPRSQKRPTKASGVEVLESSPLLSDVISEEENKDARNKGAPGSNLAVKQKVCKRLRKPGSGKQQAKAFTDEDMESSSQSDEESEEDHKDPNQKESPGNKSDGQQKGAKGGEKTGSGKQQAEASALQVNNPSSSDGESEEGEHSKKRKESSQSDEDGKKMEITPKQDGGNSDADSDNERESTTKTKESGEDSDCSSSSLTSLEDDEGGKGGSAPAKKLTQKTGDKKRRKDDDSKKEKGENKAVLRLKRYISQCGVRRKYKDLLQNCRSIRSKVAVLKQELEALGVEGTPTIQKCKAARLKREEAQELAELDISNIINTQGRPKRRAASAWTEPTSSPAARYKRTVNSDSDEGTPTVKGSNGGRHWGNLKGIVSDDGDSD